MTRAAASAPSKIVVAAYRAEEINVTARSQRSKCASPSGRRKTHGGGDIGHVGEGGRSAERADRGSAAANDPKVRTIVPGEIEKILRASKAVSFRDQ